MCIRDSSDVDKLQMCVMSELIRVVMNDGKPVNCIFSLFDRFNNLLKFRFVSVFTRTCARKNIHEGRKSRFRFGKQLNQVFINCNMSNVTKNLTDII